MWMLENHSVVIIENIMAGTWVGWVGLMVNLSLISNLRYSIQAQPDLIFSEFRLVKLYDSK